MTQPTLVLACHALSATNESVVYGREKSIRANVIFLHGLTGLCLTTLIGGPVAAYVSTQREARWEKRCGRLEINAGENGSWRTRRPMSRRKLTDHSPNHLKAYSYHWK